MITLYNETKGAWEIEKMNDSVIRLSKTKEFTKLEDNDGNPKRKRTISILTYAPIFNDMNETKTTLYNARMTAAPMVLTNKPSAVIFNNKEFKPFVTERNYNLKNVLIGSLFLGGKKIINVRNDHTFLLEFFVLGAEFSFITSFNNEGAMLSIDLLDEKTGMVTKCRFSQVDGKIIVNKTEHFATDRDKRSDFQIKIFRPSRPTNLILVHPKDVKALEQTIDTSKHKVVVYEKIDQVLGTLTDQHYKAVTLFAKSKFKNETADEEKRYAYVIKKLKTRFQTVFKLHADGKVQKVKYK